MDEKSDSRDISVLYIAGIGRSGSTLLDNILGQVEGYTSVGELRNIPERFYLAKWTCGCGKELRKCKVWNAVFDHAFNGFDLFMADRFMQLREMTTRPLRMMQMVAGWPEGTGTESYAREYAGMLDKLYYAIAEVTGARVIVDSSKFSSQGYLYARYGQVPLQFLHLVRDPRAVVHSWRRPKVLVDSPDQRTMYTYPVLKTSIRWTYMNLMADLLPGRAGARSMRLRYEDFIREPQRYLQNILNFAGTLNAQLPFSGERSVRIEPDRNHTMSGNPNRMTQGDLELKMDDAWRKATSSGTLLVPALVGAPLMFRYGYLWGTGR